MVFRYPKRVKVSEDNFPSLLSHLVLISIGTVDLDGTIDINEFSCGFGDSWLY